MAVVDPGRTLKEGDVAHVALPISIYSVNTFPVPYDGFHRLWRLMILTVSGTEVTLGEAKQMYAHHSGKQDGFEFTPEFELSKEFTASGVCFWIPTIWLAERKPPEKKECDCPWMEVYKFGCRKGHK